MYLDSIVAGCNISKNWWHIILLSMLTEGCAHGKRFLGPDSGLRREGISSQPLLVN
jgi:hypothetical protein